MGVQIANPGPVLIPCMTRSKVLQHTVSTNMHSTKDVAS